MNKSANRLIHTEPAETIPVTCPHCAAALGTIDARDLEELRRVVVRAWKRDDDEPLCADCAEISMIRSACPSCGTELVLFLVLFECDRGEDAPAEEPRLSAALHAASFISWAMIECAHDGVAIAEHVFGPILGEHGALAYERIREILPDLPRPGVASEENVL